MERIITARITSDERETHIYHDPIRKVWTMDSTVPKHFNKALKQGWNPLSRTVYEDGTVVGMILEVAGNAISIRNPANKRVMTEEQKQAAAERLANARKITE